MSCARRRPNRPERSEKCLRAAGGRAGVGLDPHVRRLPLLSQALCREQQRSCLTRRLKIKTMFPASLRLNPARVRGR